MKTVRRRNGNTRIGRRICFGRGGRKTVEAERKGAGPKRRWWRVWTGAGSDSDMTKRKRETRDTDTQRLLAIASSDGRLQQLSTHTASPPSLYLCHSCSFSQFALSSLFLCFSALSWTLSISLSLYPLISLVYITLYGHNIIQGTRSLFSFYCLAMNESNKQIRDSFQSLSWFPS